MNNQKFSRRFVSLNETLDGVNKLNPKKTLTNYWYTSENYFLKRIMYHFCIFHNFNNELSSCYFPVALKYVDIRLIPLKYADVRLSFKKDDETDKWNYRFISILLYLSKAYESLMYNEMYPFLIKSFRNHNVVFVKVLTQNSV